MGGGWDTFVYQTDATKEDPKTEQTITYERYVGQFFDDASANVWVGEQATGTYDVTKTRPRDRKATP